jgi:hypothetical protein
MMPVIGFSLEGYARRLRATSAGAAFLLSFSDHSATLLAAEFSKFFCNKP